MCTNMRTMVTDMGFIKQIPCKYLCTECRNMRREDFSQRLKFEYKKYNYVGSFISLTYRDDDLPILLPAGSAIVGKYFGSIPPAFGSTLHRRDLSQFCDKLQKRLRRKYGRSGKYIGFGDYGEDTHRPHYHLIFLGCPQDRHLIYDTWEHGNIDVGNIDNGAIRYVLDYINKDPIFADSKYELYGDFEPPFYHFSKGLGFDEIEKMIEKGMFDDLGRCKWTEKHTYTLPPYLKEKYGFISKYQYYPDSVINWSKTHKIKDLEAAQANRCEVVERNLIRAKVARGGLKLDLQKAEKNEMTARQNRFIGFQDYQDLDLLLGLK